MRGARAAATAERRLRTPLVDSFDSITIILFQIYSAPRSKAGRHRPASRWHRLNLVVPLLAVGRVDEAVGNVVVGDAHGLGIPGEYFVLATTTAAATRTATTRH